MSARDTCPLYTCVYIRMRRSFSYRSTNIQKIAKETQSLPVVWFVVWAPACLLCQPVTHDDEANLLIMHQVITCIRSLSCSKKNLLKVWGIVASTNIVPTILYSSWLHMKLAPFHWALFFPIISFWHLH